MGKDVLTLCCWLPDSSFANHPWLFHFDAPNRPFLIQMHDDGLLIHGFVIQEPKSKSASLVYSVSIELILTLPSFAHHDVW